LIASYFNSLPLYQLLRRGSTRFNLELAFFVVLTGLTNAGLLAIINAAAQAAQNAAANGQLLAMFAVTIALYVYIQRYILRTTVTEVERILSDIRIRIADRIRHAELEPLEQIGRADILGVLSRETQFISQATSALTIALQSSMLVLFSVCYIAILSKLAFVLTVGLTGLGLVLHFRWAPSLHRLLHQTQVRENSFLGSLTHVLEGFKETRLSRARSDDLFQHLRHISTDVETIKTRAGTEFSAHYVFAQTVFYGLLAAIVFVLPRYSAAYSEVVLKLTAAVLFIIGPLTSIVSTVPMYTSANVAALNIFALEKRLEAWNSPDRNGRPEAAPPAAFTSLDLRGVTFQYAEHGASGAFRIGPIDLQVASGQTVFIVGGNGGGKSTLLKTLTGLYRPQQGSITMDDTRFAPETATWYRSHFSAVFSDYHLFDQLYGLRDVPPERVNELLQLMQIADKTAFEHGRFTNLDLSTGQRKRLALIVALLEDRPILVLDEWAADQDPLFRKFFYETILTDLKRQGKTIIAATHDDRYFGIADRVVKMEYGELSDYTAV
jgi:putative ATP-binding cassette transporter